jgi:hypothetical protein
VLNSLTFRSSRSGSVGHLSDATGSRIVIGRTVVIPVVVAPVGVRVVVGATATRVRTPRGIVGVAL